MQADVKSYLFQHNARMLEFFPKWTENATRTQRALLYGVCNKK